MPDRSTRLRGHLPTPEQSTRTKSVKSRARQRLREEALGCWLVEGGQEVEVRVS